MSAEVPTWLDGNPTGPGIYWIEGCDDGGWPCVSLFLVSVAHPRGKKFSLPEGASFGEVVILSQEWDAELVPTYTRIDQVGFKTEFQAPWRGVRHIKVEEPKPLAEIQAEENKS